MATRINGSVRADQSLSGSLQYYIVYMLSPSAFTIPDANPIPTEEYVRQMNVQVTGDLNDQSQKNFEILFQSIGLRAVPVIFSNPMPVEDLSAEGAPTLTGEGFVWKFACERSYLFHDYTDGNPVGLLVKELDGVIISSGVRVTTTDSHPSGTVKNIEFVSVEKL